MALTLAQIKAMNDATLMTKIAEEAAEVIQAVCKHANHGVAPIFQGVTYNNPRDVNTEAAQLSDLLYEYRERFGFAGHRLTQQQAGGSS